MSDDLYALAARARAASDRLLHARAAMARHAELAHLNALVTPAPLAETGPDGPLYGVPVTVKDSFETEGVTTTASHPPLAAHLPDKDAALVAALRASGAVILGKTNLSELCSDIQCRSPIFGTTLNPWDTSRTSGGSSGGGAVAVATGLSRLDLASDLAGSLRIPAAFCGVAALKGGRGRFDMRGHIPPLGDGTVSPLQSGGFIARYCADLAAAFTALTGETVDACGSGPLRLGLISGAPLPLCARSREGLRRAEAWLRASEASLSDAPLDFKAAWEGYASLLMGEASKSLPSWQKIGLRGLAVLAPDRPLRQSILRALAGVSPEAGARKVEAVTASIDAHLGGVDALLAPVAATTAFAHLPPPSGRFAQRRIAVDGQSLGYQEASIGFTAPFSMSGHPVIVLPIDLVDGLPVGLQVIGRRGGEAALIALARSIETIFNQYRPPLWQQWRSNFLVA